MKFCGQCGNQLSDSSEFCGKCGARADPMVPPMQKPLEKREKPVSRRVKFAAIIAAVLVIGLILSVLLLDSGKESAGEADPRIPESPVEDFAYEISNGEIIITQYLGTDREINIPAEIEGRPVTAIGDGAFKRYDLTYIYIPDTVTIIEEYAFLYCLCLEEVRFSNNLESIENNAFEHCEALREVTLPEGLVCLESHAFSNCISLTKVQIPGSLPIIDEYAFAYCEALETVLFTEGLEAICMSAFNGCIKLSEVNLPDSLERMERCAFAECDSLQYLKIPDNTALQIAVRITSVDSECKHCSFSTPFGIESWYENAPSYMGEEYTTITPLPTILVVDMDSYAHSQLVKYSHYGVLQFEVR